MSSSGNATVINDRYEIHKRVGRGGMADVFLANDLLLNRQVAMKVLFPEFAVDPNFVERFRREAQSAANLSHPNIVNVYDWGKYEGTYFIAMEYVHGRTLAEILKTNDRLTPKQSAEIASEVAAALGFAHEAGLAHRDIKPANILIGANGQVKVADFGIARAMNAGTEANLTQAGSVMGTASYFSPEQAQGAQPDPRSDLYSLGIVMYEMVAGKPPFTGENPVSIAYKQVHDQPQPLNQLIDGVPRPFEAIVAKLLAKNPKLRYPTAHALRDDLRRFRNGEQVQALVAAAAVAPGIAPATPMAGHTVSTTPESAASPTPRQPTVPGAPTEVVADQRSTDLAEYPPGASPDARYYQDTDSRTGWYALAAFIALIALAAGGVLLYQNLTEASSQTSQRIVGNYVNMNRDQAVAAVEAQGLKATPVPEDNATVQPDVVHRTDPPAGQVLPSGDEVKLFYNPVPTLIQVPDVSKRDFPTAEKVLKDNGFQVVQETEVNDEVDEGLVIRTDPAADSLVSQVNPITVFVSAGPNEVLIPLNLINESEESVRAILEGDPYNFDVRTETRFDDEIEAGTVLSVVPESNTAVQPGSEVTLIVSQGPTQVVVPDVRGLTENEARDRLDSAELGVEVTYRELEPNDPNVGLVLEQSFTPDAEVDRGLTMAITVGRARAVVETDPPATTTAPTQPATTPAPTQAPTTTTTAAPTTTQPPTTTTTAAPSTNPGNG